MTLIRLKKTLKTTRTKLTIASKALNQSPSARRASIN